MRFLRAVLSAAAATLPVLVLLLIPQFVHGGAGDPGLAALGGPWLNALFLAAIILIPKINGALDPQVPDWTSSTAMASTGRVWRTRIWFAILAALALLAVFAAGQTAAYFVGVASPAVVDGALDYSRFLVQEVVVYVFGYVLSLTVYTLIIRALVRPEPDARKR
ncbi:hypothetical protein IF188_01200 [Microbacterium sp. NEAU-LLC]|uniref:Uncharacterized protein n=1 Tax=Microbacterium helvum TaxID=2773713 RepID=A0ABR8NIX8_9MICO|nr:hypothetical protein [Microbacterium helvum]MBD3940313.1 hypothetical protein [Microbacterium helvum]